MDTPIQIGLFGIPKCLWDACSGRQRLAHIASIRAMDPEKRRLLAESMLSGVRATDSLARLSRNVAPPRDGGASTVLGEAIAFCRQLDAHATLFDAP